MKTVDLIVNPASGPPSARLPRGDRMAYASRVLASLGAGVVRPTVTAAIGDGARAARAGIGQGTDLVVVWGGDGTLNEVAAALLNTGVPLGIVAGGSGNGLARGLGLPRRVDAALRVAMLGGRRVIDTGSVEGRTFLNVAGVGLDAAVAERFNRDNRRRGLRPYVSALLHEWWRFPPRQFQLTLDDAPAAALHAHLVVVCNGQQYGHGARVAPRASFDDGALDVVAIPAVTLRRLTRDGWRLFTGSLDRAPGVLTARAQRVTLSHAHPLAVHLDGEVVAGGTSRTFQVQPRSLCVMCPDAR